MLGCSGHTDAKVEYLGLMLALWAIRLREDTGTAILAVTFKQLAVQT